MNLYTHLIIAHELQDQLQLDSLADYYLGAIAPDIRYYLGIDRQQTHIPSERMAGYAGQHPHLRSFALGYMVHCETDNAPLPGIFRFPLSLTRRRLPAQLTPVLIEFYFLESKRLRLQVSELGNEMLSDLGIAQIQLTPFAEQVNHFLSAPSFESGLGAAQKLGIFDHPGAQKYLDVAQTIRRWPLLKRLLFAGLNTRLLLRQVSEYVLACPYVAKQAALAR